MIFAACAAVVGAFSRNAFATSCASAATCSSLIFAASMPFLVRRMRSDWISIWLIAPVPPECTARELVTIDVPIWPGMTTEHFTCGALSFRSFISDSEKPFTANFAAL